MRIGGGWGKFLLGVGSGDWDWGKRNAVKLRGERGIDGFCDGWVILL